MPTSQFFNWKVHGPIAKPSASVLIVPWAGSKANTNWNTRSQGSTALGGGSADSTGAQNAEISWDIWLDDGTYKFAIEFFQALDRGIFSIQLDGVEQGTVDAYGAGGNYNHYAEVTGIVVTKGLKTFKLKMATKNASSSNYFGNAQSCAWIRTGA